MGRQERPVTPGPLYEFARDLRQLRVAAGSPPYRLLARKAGYSASALSAAATGDMLPSLDVTLAYVGAAGGDQQFWQSRWAALAARLRHTDPGLLELEVIGRDRPLPQPDTSAPHAGEPGVAAGNVPETARPLARARLVVVPMLLLGAIIAALAILDTGGHHRAGLVAGPTATPTPGVAVPDARTSVGASGAGGSRAQTVKFGFEDGTTQTWGPFWNGRNITAAATDRTVYDGTYALQLRANTHYDRPPAFGTSHIDGLTAGAVVTFHLWYGGQGSGSILPFVEDNAGVRWARQTFALPAAIGWHTFTWSVPDTTPRSLGIQFNTTDTADVVVAIDSVTWSPA